MPLLIYPPNQRQAGEKFYGLYPTNKENKDIFANEIPLSEMAVFKGTEKYFVLAFTAFRRPSFEINNRDSTTREQVNKNIPVYIPIRYKEGVGYQGREEKPTEIEVHFHELINEYQNAEPVLTESDETKRIFSAKLIYDPNNIGDSGFDDLEAVQQKDLPELPSVSFFTGLNGNGNGAKKNGYGGTGKTYIPAPTDYERCSDREKKIIESFPTEWEIHSIADIAAYQFYLDDAVDFASQVNGTPLKEIKDKKLRAKVVTATWDLYLSLMKNL